MIVLSDPEFSLLKLYEMYSWLYGEFILRSWKCIKGQTFGKQGHLGRLLFISTYLSQNLFMF